MRLFLALRLPDAVVSDLDDALGALRERHPQLRWIPPERWHLTLAFFGEVPAREVDALRRRISRRLGDADETELWLAGAGRFGDRVLWVGVGGATAALRAVADRMAVEDRAYRPHLTVARTRERADLRPVVEQLRDYVGPRWRATRVELIESHLGPRPMYETLEQWPLGATQPPH